MDGRFEFAEVQIGVTRPLHWVPAWLAHGEQNEVPADYPSTDHNRPWKSSSVQNLTHAFHGPFVFATMQSSVTSHPTISMPVL